MFDNEEAIMNTRLTAPPLSTAPDLRRQPLLRLFRVGATRWRVTDSRSRIIGHVEAHTTPAGTRYHALRLHAPSGAFRDLGEFWSPDDAIDCLRYM